ncbi:MAG: MerC family mercury resistance protein [Anaerolineae bacterium]
MQRRVKWSSPELLGNLFGAGGTAFSALAMLVCCGFTGVATLVSAVGLGALVRADVGLPVLYFFLAFNLATLLWSARTHRRTYPVLLSLSGAGLLYYVWNHVLEVWVWLTIDVLRRGTGVSGGRPGPVAAATVPRQEPVPA